MSLAHEDEHLACVDKPCDIRLSVPRGTLTLTLALTVAETRTRVRTLALALT